MLELLVMSCRLVMLGWWSAWSGASLWLLSWTSGLSWCSAWSFFTFGGAVPGGFGVKFCTILLRSWSLTDLRQATGIVVDCIANSGLVMLELVVMSCRLVMLGWWSARSGASLWLLSRSSWLVSWSTWLLTGREWVLDRCSAWSKVSFGAFSFIVTVLFSCIFSLRTRIFSNLSNLFHSSALCFSVCFLSFLSLAHLFSFSSIYWVTHLAIAHLSSNCFFFSLLSFFSWFCLSSCSCFCFFSAKSFFLFSSYSSFAFLFSSTSFFILSKVFSNFSNHSSWFCLWLIFTSSFFLSSSLLHFFHMFTFISLRSRVLCFSSCCLRCLCSCSGSLLHVSVIFIWSCFSKLLFSCNWFFLFFASFLFLSVNLSSSSTFHVFSFSFRYVMHSFRSSQLFSCFSFFSSLSSLSLSISLFSSWCFLKASSQLNSSTVSYSP